MGRPKIEIPSAQLEKFVHNGSPVSEIAAYFGVCESTIRKRFQRQLAKARAFRGMLLRKMQWKSAEEGSVPMQIFLGKHELRQGAEQPRNEAITISRRAVNRHVKKDPVPGSRQLPGAAPFEPREGHPA